MTEKKKLKLKIFDKEYALVVEDPKLALELANYVTEVMEETKRDLENQPNETVAIISALNIAYDLFIEKNSSKEYSIQATEKVRKIKLLLTESDSIMSPS